MGANDKVAATCHPSSVAVIERPASAYPYPQSVYPDGVEGLVPVYFCPCQCSKLIDAAEYKRLVGRSPAVDRRRPIFFHEKTPGGCYCWMGEGECLLHEVRR